MTPYYFKLSVIKCHTETRMTLNGREIETDTFRTNRDLRVGRD